MEALPQRKPEAGDGGGADAEDIPSDFFDDFNKADFIEGLSVIDSWDDKGHNPKSNHRRFNAEVFEKVKDLRELMSDDKSKWDGSRDDRSRRDGSRDDRTRRIGSRDDRTRREGSREDKRTKNEPPKQRRSSSISRLDEFIKPGSRRDPNKTNEAIKRDKEEKVKEFLAKSLESSSADLRPPGTELDDYFEGVKPVEKKAQSGVEPLPQRLRSRSRERRRESPRKQLHRRSPKWSPRRSPVRRRPSRSPRRPGSSLWRPSSPVRVSVGYKRYKHYSPGRERRSSPRRSPRRHSPRRSPRYSPRMSRRSRSRSPYRQPCRSRSPTNIDNFLYPSETELPQNYGPPPLYQMSQQFVGPPSDYQGGPPPPSGPTSDYQSVPASDYQSVPASDYQGGPPSDYQSGPASDYQGGPPSDYQSGPPSDYQGGPPSDYQGGPPPPVYPPYAPAYDGYNAPYDYGGPPMPVPQPVPMIPVPAPVPNPVPPPIQNLLPPPSPMPPAVHVPVMVPAPLMMPPTPLMKQADTLTPYDALAKLVAEGKISKEDYLKLAPNKGIGSTSDDKSKVTVLNRCSSALMKLKTLDLPNQLLFNHATPLDPEPKYIAPKFCSPLKRQAPIQFQFTSPSGPSSSQQNKHLIDSIIAAVGLEKVVSRPKKKIPKNKKDAACQTVKAFCDVCEIRESTKFSEAATSIDRDHFSSSVHTQVVEQDLVSSKSVFNPSGSVGDGASMSIAHLTPAQLVSQLAARAKTLKNPEPAPSNQYRRNKDYDYNYDNRGGQNQQYPNYNNYRY